MKDPRKISKLWNFEKSKFKNTNDVKSCLKLRRKWARIIVIVIILIMFLVIIVTTRLTDCPNRDSNHAVVWRGNSCPGSKYERGRSIKGWLYSKALKYQKRKPSPFLLLFFKKAFIVSEVKRLRFSPSVLSVY